MKFFKNTLLIVVTCSTSLVYTMNVTIGDNQNIKNKNIGSGNVISYRNVTPTTQLGNTSVNLRDRMRLEDINMNVNKNTPSGRNVISDDAQITMGTGNKISGSIMGSNQSVNTNSNNNIPSTNIQNNVQPKIKTIKLAGQSETTMVSIPGITNINAANMGDVTIEQCTNCEESLIITADKNILPYITYKISNQQLKFGLKNSVNIPEKTPITYHVIVKDINKISTQNMVNVTTNTIKTKNLKIEAAGETNINASLDVQDLKANISGNSTVTVSGKTNKQTINASNNSQYNAANFVSQTADIETAGLSSATVHAKKDANYKASGASTITYQGAKPKISTSGGAKIKKG